MIPKNYVCRSCGKPFRHPRHRFDHQLDTGHGIDSLKSAAKMMARVARATGRCLESMDGLTKSIEVTRTIMVQLMRTMGRRRAKRWARNRSRR